MPPSPTMLSSRQLTSQSRCSISRSSPSRPIIGVGGTGMRETRGRREMDAGKLDSVSVRCSPRATLMKSFCCSMGISSALAINSATWREGRRSSRSILWIVAVEQPTRSARSFWVKSSALRRRFIQAPIVSSGLITVPAVIGVPARVSVFQFYYFSQKYHKYPSALWESPW